ncbi:Leucine rich repeat containing protein BspA family protein [Entamoeba marina]
MSSHLIHNLNKLDSYSMLIVSKYFESQQDYINTICVCKKFKETTEKLRFNPISITTMKLFPKLQTQYLYNKNEVKLKGINNYEICYTIDYEDYLKQNKQNEQIIKFHHITFTKDNRKRFGVKIPNDVNMLGVNCFDSCVNLQNVVLSNSLLTIPNSCFSGCISLKSINITAFIQSLGNYCFNECSSLTSINIHNSVTSIGIDCFESCVSLQSITLPTSLVVLENNTFACCLALTNIVLPITLTSIEDSCFLKCTQLSSITLPSSLNKIGKWCFFKLF